MKNRYFISLSVFILGFVLAIVSWQFPVSKQFIIDVGHSGLLGALLVGVLYSFAFTSSIATAIFSAASYDINPLIVAFFGGLGAAIYDLTIFTFVRTKVNSDFFQSMKRKIHRRKNVINILLSFFGFIILASPLPDELAAGFLGFSKLKVKQFVFVSFLANFLGILVILIIAH